MRSLFRGAKVGDLYKFFIVGYHGEELYKVIHTQMKQNSDWERHQELQTLRITKWKDTNSDEEASGI